jgi:hypothetical protein
VLAAIAFADELLQSGLGVLLPLGGLQTVIIAVVATAILSDWDLMPKATAEALPEDVAGEPAQSSGPKR